MPNLAVLVFLACLACPLSAAEMAEPHRVVLQLTGADATWDGALRNVDNLKAALPGAEVVLVVHDQAIGLLLAADNPRSAKIAEQAQGGVAFVACANTMKRKGIAKDQLLASATTVDAGIAEVVRRQEAGFSYVRLAN